MKIKEICKYLEEFAPLTLQEPYDNSGLLVGDPDHEVNKALITLDITEEVIQEAIDNNCGLIISHHPIIFNGLKQITVGNHVERVIIAAIQHDIALYAIHTNLDNVAEGVNGMISKKLGLINQRVLQPAKDILKKLVTFAPAKNAESVRQAIFDAGGGHIGNYDYCSFNMEGEGSFRANEDANPHVGEINKIHYEKEARIEVIYPSYKEKAILSAMLKTHPYEEVAYDIYPLDNKFNNVGAGLIGELPVALDDEVFLNRVKEIFQVPCIRHSRLLGKPIKHIALCGGSGSFLLKTARLAGADIFLTGDVKYHQFFETENTMVIADIGHYESEQFTKDLIHQILIKKIPNFALQISEVNTNAVNYI